MPSPTFPSISNRPLLIPSHRSINPSKSALPLSTLNPKYIISFLMKLSLYSLLRSRLQPVRQNASKHFFSSTPSVPAPVRTQSASDKLYNRLARLGDPNVSMVPTLDQWVQEGRNVAQQELRDIVKEMEKYRRYKHALEISQWMTDRRFFTLSQSDVLVRLTLINKVHGIEQAEKYFKNIPQIFNRSAVYIALLNCYVKNKSVEKAESVMQKLRDMGCANSHSAYSILLGLYYHLGDLEKLENLLHEMEEKGIKGDIYTFTICLSAYAAASDKDKIEIIMKRIESNPRIVMNWKSYSVAANAHHKVGLVDKSLELLKKIEELMKTRNPTERTAAFNFLLRMYGKMGRRDELTHIWNLYRKERIFNKGYKAMISSVLMFDDIKDAKKILDEWESRNLSYDFRIPNCLIDACLKDGQLKEAEALVNRGIEKGGNPTFHTWRSLAGGYIEDNQVVEAIKALKKAIPRCPPHPDPVKDRLSTCLEYFFSASVLEKLRNFILDSKSKSGKLHFSYLSLSRCFNWLSDLHL